MNIFKKITNIRDSKPLIVPFALLLLSISLLPSNYAISKYLETTIYPYLVIGIGFILSTSILILSYFKKRKSKEFIQNETMD